MKLKACYWVPALALLSAAPAWANSSWGQMGQFRPGIQLGIVVLVLLTETIIVGSMTRMSWLGSGVAVAVANGLSYIIGLPLMTGPVMKMTSLPVLLWMAIPSTILEFLVVNAVARHWSARKAQRGEWAFIGVLVANLLSALVTFGYLYANYRGETQPILWREVSHMQYVAGELQGGIPKYGDDLGAVCKQYITAAGLLRAASRPAQLTAFDLAPPWLPWAQMRLAPYYESALPRRLDPPGRGHPIVWSGARYLAGKRGVIFSDGRFELMTERAFRQLGATPAPPQITIPMSGASRAPLPRRTDTGSDGRHGGFVPA